VVGPLGAGVPGFPRLGYTQITVDGGSVLFPANVGASLNLSQEAVQEFQLSTVNFDVATGLTTSGSVNIVTPSGGNDFHGAGFFFFRDHNLAAYPGLRRDPSNPNPFFQRRQSGYKLGGPIKKERAFFFTNFERNDQRGVLSVQPRTPEFVSAGGIFPTPYRESQFTARFDWRLHPMHTLFARYTHDGNNSFAPNGAAGTSTSLPSNWSRLNNFVDQSLIALTSVLSPTVVNDLRFSYFFDSGSEAPGGPQDCPGCLGLGAPRILIPDANITLGNPRTLSFVARRYQLTEGLTWQRTGHRLRFGFNWEQTAFS
jgi:hypothetical protein